MSDDELARRVRDRRLELGYDTQQEAAAKAKVSSTTWGLLESRGQVPGMVRTRRRVAELLQWSPDAFELPEGRAQATAPLPQGSVDLQRELAELRGDLAALQRSVEAIAETLRSGRPPASKRSASRR